MYTALDKAMSISFLDTINLDAVHGLNLSIESYDTYFSKKTNFVEATKLQRQKLELGFNQIPSKYLKEDIIDFVGDLNEKMIE